MWFSGSRRSRCNRSMAAPAPPSTACNAGSPGNPGNRSQQRGQRTQSGAVGLEKQIRDMGQKTQNGDTGHKQRAQEQPNAVTLAPSPPSHCRLHLFAPQCPSKIIVAHLIAENKISALASPSPAAMLVIRFKADAPELPSASIT